MNCPRCGAEWEKKMHSCPACGYRRSIRPALLIGLIAAAVVLVAGMAAGIWWLVRYNGGGQEPETDFPTDPLAVSSQVSHTVQVTIPEGYTIERMAELLEEKEVCTAEEFRWAVQHGDFSHYDFVQDIPVTDENDQPNGRFYRLEGYLFPDTYEFYRNGGGEAAVSRFLDNFERKLEDWQEALDTSGLTLDQAVTLASIIQGEARTATDMERVSRVLHNRLASVEYPRLQCDVTTKYLRDMAEAGNEVQEDAYDTYVCFGLPVGAINNPGLSALKAAVSPSDEAICADCYFFVTDTANNAVYYTRTYEEHLAVCREHKLGAYAES